MTDPVPLEKANEAELLKRARAAMNRAMSLPIGSVARSVQWGVFDTVMAELDRRYDRWWDSRLEKR